MKLPVYTELSNFSTRMNNKKVPMDLSIVLVINSLSDPVDSMNAIYNLTTRMKQKSEVILINIDKDGYMYDKLLSTFPAMRVLLPQNKMTLKEAICLGASESLANNILFIDEFSVIKTMNLEVLDMYLSETGFGILIPHITDDKNEVIPNIIKGNARHGFINTISTDIIGTAVSSIYPKYFCFILNREAFIGRNIELNDYEKQSCTLLELGYRIWKEGFIITQSRNFKVLYTGRPVEDIVENETDRDYLLFNFMNLAGKDITRGRGRKVLSAVFRSLSRFRFEAISALFAILKNARRNRQNILSKPVEDFTIFSIINKDIK